ncbi:MAG: hypothetical protein CEN89_500 [Candidatus Berkelbacteria bacterium Licking1014_7]|uniref:Uncharacterized protein n=1 Tax=Candidatus Berkelbacteria bacterium Licking1014_7 TaxID=2017147 RepID=A0A554LIN1_9BACT|nr:MAG: hypothetical protein CEN89_500 [Candidatus Berkelbacteria bacterium Licking1014_7]
MKIIDAKNQIAVSELKKMTKRMYEDLIKVVVDVKKEIMAVDAELHADQEEYLLGHGSRQSDLWGINLHPNKNKEGLIEFDSMINLRPSQGNRTRGVDDLELQKKIIEIVRKLII